MLIISLHIFTNSTKFSPSTKTILRTYKSFQKTFDLKNIETTVWLDPNPNIDKSDNYYKNLQRHFTTVRIARSLSDAYLMALNESKSKYLFMLEHDWVFVQSKINHSMNFILNNFPEKISHFRFNQFKNITNWQLHKGAVGEIITKPEINGHLTYSLTNCASNNPHIIHKERYFKSGIEFIKISSGSNGIEENLWGIIDSAVYGDIGHPATIRHTNGKLGLLREYMHRLKTIIFY